MASFQVKMRWKMLRRLKINKVVPMSTYPTRNRKFKKNRKKIQKIKKHHCGFFSSQNMLGKAEKERKEKIKIKIVAMSSYPTRN